jgi:hypothetical protein
MLSVEIEMDREQSIRYRKLSKVAPILSIVWREAVTGQVTSRSPQVDDSMTHRPGVQRT